MLHKVLFFLPAAIIAILAIQNMAIGTFWFFLLKPNTSVGIIVLASAILGTLMWYSFKHVFSEKSDESAESYDHF